MKLLLKFDDKPVGHTAHWIDLGSDYERIRQSWISEAKEEAKLATELGIYVINFHSSAMGMTFKKENDLR